MNYEILKIFREKTMTPEFSKREFQLLEVDADTTRDIILEMIKDYDESKAQIDVDSVLDQFQKHVYIEMNLDWYVRQHYPMTPVQTHVVVICTAGEIQETKRHRLKKPQEKHRPDEWIMGEFASHNQITDDVSLAMKMVTVFILEALMTRPWQIVQSPGHRTVLERSKGRQRFTSVHLSDVGKRYVREGGEPGSGGWRMPEHDVRGHYRQLSDGRRVFVRGHKRGDPAVERKTPLLTRVYL